MDINRTKFLEDYMIHVDYNGDTLNYLPEYTYERYDRDTDMFYGLIMTKTARQVADESIAKLEENKNPQPTKTVAEKIQDLQDSIESCTNRVSELQEAIVEIIVNNIDDVEG